VVPATRPGDSSGPAELGATPLRREQVRDDRRMLTPRLEPELLEHLRVEFHSGGKRAVEFLVSAQWLLESEPGSVPRLGEAVAYACREALGSITEAGKTNDGDPWRKLSRSVVAAARRYKLHKSSQSEDTEQLLSALLATIEEMRRFHKDESSLHQRRLIAVILDRAGVSPHSGAQPIAAFQDLWTRLNDALHGDCSVADAREMWSDCVALLRQLFLPAPLRLGELERLARIETPGEADLGEVLSLAGTSVHLKQFVRLVASPNWLRLLDSAGVLDGPDMDLWWAAATAAARLAPDYLDEVVTWLEDLKVRYGDDPERARCIASAARRIGEPAAELLLQVLNSHQGDAGIVMEAVNATRELDASSEAVADSVDLLFNESNWPHLYLSERLADHLAAGIVEHNARRRIKLVGYKLRSVPETDYVLRRLRSERAGSISDFDEPLPGERAAVLVTCTVSMLRRAWDWLPADELVSLLEPVPDGLRQRLRSWVLAHAPDVDPVVLVSEVGHAISSRLPNGDDVSLIGRALESAEGDDVSDNWRNALGRAPSIEEVGRALSDASVPRDWLRSAEWSLLLPLSAAGEWTPVVQLLAARFALSGRAQLENWRQVEATISTSPFSAEDLAALTPVQAAEQIAAWRPAPGEWQNDARQLGRVLETVVRQNPDGWLVDPVGITVKLFHPTYIRSYMEGVKEVVTGHAISVTALLDVVTLVHTQPWPAEALADDPLDYDADWEEAQRVGLDLIRAMADADVDFGDRSDEVWTRIERAARDRSAGSGFLSPVDPLTSAINRPCTRAFETVLLFVAAELRAAKPPRSAFITLLDYALRLEDEDGVEYRAILAPRLGWVRQALPDWIDANIDLLFGDDAPNGLAQLTVDLAIQWSLPNRWLLENYPDMIKNAVLRDAEEAVKHFLVAMLWNCPGYQVEDIVRFTEQHHEEHPWISSKMGMILSSLIGHEDVEDHHLETALHLWKALLESSTALSLEGFGWLYKVTALDDERWAKLTLDTLQAISNTGFWVHGATERAMAQPLTATKLSLLNTIIRGQLEPWHRYHITGNINRVLENANSLQGTAEYQRLLTALRERDMIPELSEGGE